LGAAASVDHNGAVTDEQEKRDNPVVSGLIALFAVALAVGLVLAGVTLVAIRVAGIGDDSASAGSTGRESAYIPRPAKTTSNGPAVTLHTEDAEASETTETEPDKPTKSATKKPEPDITLQAAQTAVGNFERIDLTGVYPGGEGAILQVQRFEGGQWVEFGVTIPVSNQTFSTYVQSAQTGVNRFRVVDNATGEPSNQVKVTVG
jgi:hypothetical protein